MGIDEHKTDDNTLIPYHYKAVLKFICLTLKESDSFEEEFQHFINELTAFLPQVPIRGNNYPFIFSVDDYDNIIRINTTIYVPKDKSLKIHNDFYDEYIEGRIKDLCFVINLAHPSLLHINDGKIYRNGKIICNHFKYSSDFFSLADELCVWPTIKKLTIEECWNWILNKTNFLSDLSRIPIDRALHALSYSNADENTYIFYVLLGIEAIYNDGSNKEDSILEQLKRKTKAILGEYPSDKEKYVKKQINEMYRMRSLLVHGSTNISKCWNAYDSSNDEFDKFMEQREPVIFATAILLATIQKFIKANANSITETITLKLE